MPTKRISQRQHKNGQTFEIHQDAPDLFSVFPVAPGPQWTRPVSTLAAAQEIADRQASSSHNCSALGCPAWADFDRAGA